MFYHQFPTLINKKVVGVDGCVKFKKKLHLICIPSTLWLSVPVQEVMEGGQQQESEN